MDDRVPGYLGRLLTADREPAGTCFQVDPGVLVTACHVLDDLDAARPDAEVLVDPLAGGDPRPARVLRVDPIHDLAVLRVDEPLPASVAGLAPSDEVRARTDAQVLGVALVDDAEHEYRYAPAVGEWLGPTVRDEEVPLAVFSSRNVARGMSGGPVRRMTDDVVVGVVSGRYNTTDGWLRDTVWLARVENLLPLLDGLEFTRSTLSWDRGYSLARVAAQAFEECGGDFAVVSDLSRGRVRWEALLDGEPLTFAHAVGEAVVPRRVRHGGHEYAAAELGELLGANTGRTLYLYGDAGDGKSSFLSQLAKQLLDTHVFLRWYPGEPLALREVRRYQQLVRQLATTRGLLEPTVVVCWSPPPFMNTALEDAARIEFAARQSAEDDLVLLVEGRPGELNRLAHSGGRDRLDLVDVDDAEAAQWARLIRSARDQILALGVVDTEHLNERYPNLETFLRLDRASQVSILTDPSEPMIVRLLRAVYGDDMWAKLYRELKQIVEAVDRKAYLQVCLASIAGSGLPERMLTELVPGCDVQARGDRDPWLTRETRDGDFTHEARHPIIAQVVLEASQNTYRVVRAQCFQDYVDLAATDIRYLETLGRVISAINHLSTMSSQDSVNKLRRACRREIRDVLLKLDDLTQLVLRQAVGRYAVVEDWVDRILELVQPLTGQAVHLSLLDVADDLLDAAENLADADPDRVTYYQLKTSLRRVSVFGKVPQEELLDAVHTTFAFIRSPWCFAGFYRDVFEWSWAALDYFGTMPSTEGSIEDKTFLYGVLFTAFEYLRVATPGALRRNGVYNDHGAAMVYLVHRDLPDKAIELVYQAWQESLAHGNPNPETAALYVENAIESGTNLRGAPGQELLEMLRTSARAYPRRGETMFLRALLHTRSAIGDEAELRADVLAALTVDTHLEDSRLNNGFLNHARYLVETDDPGRRGYLETAIRAYQQHAEIDFEMQTAARGRYGFPKVEFAWHHACKALEAAGDAEAAKLRRSYERMYSRFHIR